MVVSNAHPCCLWGFARFANESVSWYVFMYTGHVVVLIMGSVASRVCKMELRGG